MSCHPDTNKITSNENLNGNLEDAKKMSNPNLEKLKKIMQLMNEIDFDAIEDEICSKDDIEVTEEMDKQYNQICDKVAELAELTENYVIVLEG